jgi:hypothetical protein
VAAIATPASALGPETFDSFTAGPFPNGVTNGWSYNQTYAYDVTIDEDAITHNKSFQISNALTSGEFDRWVYSPRLGSPATEGQEFIAQFDIMGKEYVEGLQASVAPQSGMGARMSYLGFADKPNGIEVRFQDALNGDFRNIVIGEPLTYGVPHTVKIVVDLRVGPSNDVVQVFIDDGPGLVPGLPGAATFDGFYAPVDNQPTVNKAKAGQTIPLKWRLSAPSFATTWEDYYRTDPESNKDEDNNLLPQPWGTRPVDSLIFQARTQREFLPDGQLEPVGKWSENAGRGFLFDNVSIDKSTTLSLPIASVGVSDALVYNTPPIAARVETCGQDDELDAIEVYASNNVVGLMYHGNGVWQYNWQTPKTLAGKCVEVKLSGASLTGQTDFFFTK